MLTHNRPIDEFLELLAAAPDTQIDGTVTIQLSELVGQPYEVIARQLKQILDDCAYAALASDFSMMAMDKAWQMAKEQVFE
jgi:hypothetical protein